MSEKNLPDHASVVVIGGGIMGCSTLYHLAKSGVSDAILLERNKLTSGTTWHSAAQVRALRSTRNLTDLIRYSISLYKELEQETGLATGWINKGSLSIATNTDRLEHIKRQQSLAHLFGVQAQSITVDQARERWPLMNTDDVIGAVWSPDDGRVSPSDLCSALIKGARNSGAAVHEDTSVTGIITEGDKVTGVETSRGHIRCDAIAVCSGLWSREVAAMGGVDAPLYPCEHFYLLTKPVADITGNLPTLSDHDSHLYIRDDSGGLLVGCFEPTGKAISPQTLGDDFSFQLLPEDWDHFEPMMQSALHRLPCLADAEVRMLLNGPESFTPDGSFMLGETAETRGLFLGCGMNSVGVATGGGAGMALAHCIINGHTPVDLAEADPKRFPPCFNSVEALAERVPQVLGEHYAIHYPGYQWTTSRNLRQTPLHNEWLAHGAHFGQMYGWERPLYFNKQTEPVLTMGKPSWFDQVGNEVRQAHTHAAIFDSSTFGKIEVTGSDAESFLNRICANNMQRAPGRVIYTAMLNERGGYESDLTAMRLDSETYHLYTGTSAIKRDLSWLRNHISHGERVQISDITEQYAVLAFMGPKTRDIARGLGVTELESLGFYHHVETEFGNVKVRAARLSYVGEPGWEISCKSSDASQMLSTMTDAGALPAGAFAQTSMRIEKGFLAYGHDLDADINPLQAGLADTLDWNSKFIGKSALQEIHNQKIDTRMVTIVLTDKESVPLGNEPVYLGEQIVGKTTSAAYGYRLDAPIALALVSTDSLQSGLPVRVQVDIAGVRHNGNLIDASALDNVFQKSSD